MPVFDELNEMELKRDKVWSSATSLFKWRFRSRRRRCCLSSLIRPVGQFRVPPGLCFKTRLGVQPLIWKSFFILMQIKLFFTRKVVHLASFWKWGFLELGSGLLLSRSAMYKTTTVYYLLRVYHFFFPRTFYLMPIVIKWRNLFYTPTSLAIIILTCE